MKNYIKKLNSLIGRNQHIWTVMIFMGLFMLGSYCVFEDIIISLYCDLIFFAMLLLAYLVSLIADFVRAVINYTNQRKNNK